MAKDAYWFKHDCNASRDVKLIELKAIYGYEGLGIFWAIIEILREQTNYAWNDEKIHVLSRMIDADAEKVENIVQDCKRLGLFETMGGFMYSNRLKQDMKAWESKKGNRTKRERNPNEIGTKTEDKSRGEERRVEESRGEERRGDRVKPTLNDCVNFFIQCKKTKEDGAKFYHHYASVDWKVGGQPVTDWASLAQKWILNSKQEQAHTW